MAENTITGRSADRFKAARLRGNHTAGSTGFGPGMRCRVDPGTLRFAQLRGATQLLPRGVLDRVGAAADRALGLPCAWPGLSLAEGIDATTPTGQLQMYIMGAIAEFERMDFGGRVQRVTARSCGHLHIAGCIALRLGQS